MMEYGHIRMSEKENIVMDSFSIVDKWVSCQICQVTILLCMVSAFYTSLLGCLFFDSLISVFPEIPHFNIFPGGTSNLEHTRTLVHNVISLIFNTCLLIRGVTVTDFASCVKWCGRTTACVYGY